MRTEDFFGQFIQELCIMLAEVMLQFMSFQPAFAHESFITMLTFSQNLPEKGLVILSGHHLHYYISPSPC